LLGQAGEALVVGQAMAYRDHAVDQPRVAIVAPERSGVPARRVELRGIGGLDVRNRSPEARILHCDDHPPFAVRQPVDVQRGRTVAAQAASRSLPRPRTRWPRLAARRGLLVRRLGDQLRPEFVAKPGPRIDMVMVRVWVHARLV
jgi:hypothetical protein